MRYLSRVFHSCLYMSLVLVGSALAQSGAYDGLSPNLSNIYRVSDAWRFSILRMYWDGETAPSVEVPVGEFFAMGWNKYAPISSQAICVNPGSAFNSYWPMPFRKGAKLTLERNVKAASKPFDEADEKLLAAELERISPYYCRMCQHCEGSCRRGLPVPDLLRFLLYAEGYGNLAAAREGFRQLPEGLQAVRCEACRECTVRCPNGVRIRERVGRAQAVLA